MIQGIKKTHNNTATQMVFEYFYTIEQVGDDRGEDDFQYFKQALLDALWSMGTDLWYVDYDDCGGHD